MPRHYDPYVGIIFYHRSDPAPIARFIVCLRRDNVKLPRSVSSPSNSPGVSVYLKIRDTIPRRRQRTRREPCIPSSLLKTGLGINCPRKIYDFGDDSLDNKQVAGSYSHVLRTRARVGRPFVDFRIDTTFGCSRQECWVRSSANNTVSLCIN